MNNFKTKNKLEQEKEIFLAEDNPRLDEDLPIATLFPPTKLIAVVKPKKVKSPYIETALLFLCAIISAGADAFIFSSSLFSKIINDLALNTTFTTVVAVVCLFVHIIPEIYWGICIYQKAVRVGNYTIILASDKIIACGRANYTQSKVIKLEDLLDIKTKGSQVTIVGINDKLKLRLNNPQEFVDLVQGAYNAL